MASVLLPLRSNAAWFAAPEYGVQLERRLKNLLMVYDELVLQDGRYRLMVGDRGVVEVVTPPQDVSDRTTIDYTPAGTPFAVRASSNEDGPWHQVVGGPAIANYEVDFYPIFHRAELLGQPYLRWEHVQLSAGAKARVQREARSDSASKGLQRLLPEGSFLQKAIVEGFYGDAVLSGGLRMPLSADFHVSRVVMWKNRQVKKSFRNDLRSVFSSTWLNLQLPDAGDATWEVIHSTRESAVGRDYRHLIGRVTEDVSSLLASNSDPREVEVAMQRLLVREIVAELWKRRTTVQDVTVSIGLNFIPLLGDVIGGALDVVKAVQERRSWVTLLGGFPLTPSISLRPR